MENNYGIKKGQIYIAADGSHFGHLVLDDTTFIDCADVVVLPFNEAGQYGEHQRIDTFKLAQVRYKLVERVPAWLAPLMPELNALKS